MKTTAWLFFSLVVLYAVSWVVLAIMLPPVDAQLAAAHPSWQALEWIITIGPVEVLFLSACTFFLLLLHSYRLWLGELSRQSMQKAPNSASSPSSPPYRRPRRKRFHSWNL